MHAYGLCHHILKLRHQTLLIDNIIEPKIFLVFWFFMFFFLTFRRSLFFQKIFQSISTHGLNFDLSSNFFLKRVHRFQKIKSHSM